VAGQDLNDKQRQAVEHSGGPLLVLAGPGTGKTGVLVARIEHLVANRGVSPARILALTFSRRAAEEMHSRVKDRVPEAAFIEMRTFHSFALSVVRRYAAVLGLRRAPEIIPTGEQWALVSDLLQDEDPARWGLAQNAFDRPATAGRSTTFCSAPRSIYTARKTSLLSPASSISLTSSAPELSSSSSATGSPEPPG
jgi:superfamily I DNA/RNA helicase